VSGRRGLDELSAVSLTRSVREISISVEGYPPAKNEAKSMLAAGHLYTDRVRLLLEAARAALGAN
jgi:hypothetical protein